VRATWWCDEHNSTVIKTRPPSTWARGRLREARRVVAKGRQDGSGRGDRGLRYTGEYLAASGQDAAAPGKRAGSAKTAEGSGLGTCHERVGGAIHMGARRERAGPVEPVDEVLASGLEAELRGDHITTGWRAPNDLTLIEERGPRTACNRARD